LQLKADAKNCVTKQAENDGWDAGEYLGCKTDCFHKPALFGILRQIYRATYANRDGNEQRYGHNINRVDDHGEDTFAARPAGGIGA